MTSKQTSERMRRIGQRDTKPELDVRRILRDLGAGYRVCPKDLPGRPDIANKSRGWAIYVHGCFWHGHRHCKLYSVPKTNSDFWTAKISSNRERDHRKEAELRQQGFRVLTIWQCEISDEAALRNRLRLFLRGSVCEHPGGDQAFVRNSKRPDYETGEAEATLVDLFAGCGGLTLGVAEACRALDRALRVELAVEKSSAAMDVYAANFSPRLTRAASEIRDWFPGLLGSRLTPSEQELAKQCPRVDLLVAGPPCQGHSNLNNHTRGNDPRNGLYERVVRATEVLAPAALLVEQVPAAKRDVNGTVEKSAEELQKRGYSVSAGKVHLVELGVPQLRERHVLMATREGTPSLASALDLGGTADTRDLRWAIGDLENEEALSTFRSASRLSRTNRERASWLIDNQEFDLPNHLRPPCHRDRPNHKYKSMYGRLRWDLPAQTITTGFGSPGQGRYLHPSRIRTLTPHEAARIQFFPDWFDFSSATTREALARVIGNAVPPKLGYVLSRYLFEVATGAEHLPVAREAS